jgi:hypothetical protein
MKVPFAALLLSLASIACASELRIEVVTQPLYLHGSEAVPQITFQPVPLVTFHSDPEWRFAGISTPFVPPTDGSWKPQDINLTSLYRITVNGTYKENGRDVLVTIDASKAKQPEDYPFTVEQVIDAVVTCVKTMFPPRPTEDGELEISITRPGKRAPVKK